MAEAMSANPALATLQFLAGVQNLVVNYRAEWHIATSSSTHFRISSTFL
jgi:hypothetical protein